MSKNENLNVFLLFYSDVFCGKLACAGGLEIPLLGNTWRTYGLTDGSECKFIETELSSDAVDEFLVRMGTMCGDGRVSFFCKVTITIILTVNYNEQSN